LYSVKESTENYTHALKTTERTCVYKKTVVLSKSATEFYIIKVNSKVDSTINKTQNKILSGNANNFSSLKGNNFQYTILERTTGFLKAMTYKGIDHLHNVPHMTDELSGKSSQNK